MVYANQNCWDIPLLDQREREVLPPVIRLAFVLLRRRVAVSIMAVMSFGASLGKVSS
jgi:hypothetical protein